jgi:hypothetical protein
MATSELDGDTLLDSGKYRHISLALMILLICRIGNHFVTMDPSPFCVLLFSLVLGLLPGDIPPPFFFFLFFFFF